MIKLNVHEAKTHLSRYLKMIKRGETIILCNRNQPVAEIRALPEEHRKRRMGLAQGQFTVPETFFEPLPGDILDAFDGNA